ncbi:hypothetical protein ACFL1I_08275 [Candidatus Omnitrophota bacterium]
MMEKKTLNGVISYILLIICCISTQAIFAQADKATTNNQDIIPKVTTTVEDIPQAKMVAENCFTLMKEKRYQEIVDKYYPLERTKEQNNNAVESMEKTFIEIGSIIDYSYKDAVWYDALHWYPEEQIARCKPTEMNLTYEVAFPEGKTEVTSQIIKQNEALKVTGFQFKIKGKYFFF